MQLPEHIVQTFLAENRELIDLLDEQIVRLESESENQDLLDEIFRAFHTLKGNAGVVGFLRFEKVAHVTEDILTQIRDSDRKITAEVVSFLLDSLDQLKVLHQSIEENGDDEVELPALSSPPVSGQEKPPEAPTADAQEKTSAPDSETPKEIVAEDGSWGLFTENIVSVVDEIDARVKAEDAEGGTASQEKPASGNDKVNRADKKASKGANFNDQWHKSESAIRVDLTLLDSLMNLVGELVLSRNQVLQYAEQQKDPDFNTTCQRFDTVTAELQEKVMKACMQPIGTVFSRFHRLVRQMATALGKKVKLTIEGAETELDKTVIDAIKDPLTHIVRNSIDHGLEEEKTRRKSGKDPAGKLALKAYYEGSQVIVEVVDDGAGIDRDKLKKKVVEKGMMTPEQTEALSDAEALNLVFLPGFSTVQEVTNISGRGVGMDVVRTNIGNVGGRVEISSAVQKGTALKIHLPVTTSIIDGLQVRIDREHYVVPLSFVLECVELHREDLTRGERRRVANVRGEIIPYIRLRERFSIPGQPSVIEQMVIAEVGDRRVGFVVDEVIGHYQTVIKSLGKIYKDVEGVSGSTILGDGSVALILDIPKLVDGVEKEEQVYIEQ